MAWFGGTNRKLDELVEVHYAALYRYAYRLCGAPSEAEDLTQETFCQAQGKLHQLREWDRAKAWLFTILRNVYLHRLRQAKQENRVPLDFMDDLPARLPEPLPDIEPAQLQAALGELPEVFRTAIVLYFFEDFSYKDIAQQMQVPLGTVMSRLARAKAFLRQRLVPLMRDSAGQGEVM